MFRTKELFCKTYLFVQYKNHILYITSVCTNTVQIPCFVQRQCYVRHVWLQKTKCTKIMFCTTRSFCTRCVCTKIMFCTNNLVVQNIVLCEKQCTVQKSCFVHHIYLYRILYCTKIVFVQNICGEKQTLFLQLFVSQN